MNDKEQTENKLLNGSTKNSDINSKCNGNFPMLCKLWYELKSLFTSKDDGIGTSNLSKESTYQVKNQSKKNKNQTIL